MSQVVNHPAFELAAAAPGVIGSAVTQLRHAFHFNAVPPKPSASAIAFTNPAVTFELYAVSAERAEESVAPRRSGALPPLWQVLRAAGSLKAKASPLPVTAFANPAVADSQPFDWTVAAPKKRPPAHAPAAQAESWHDHAQAYFSAGQYAAALECAEQALQLDVHNGAVWRLCGASQLVLQRWAEAAQAFQHATALRPSDVEAWLGWGRAQLQLEQFEAALNSLSHALAHAANHCEALFYQGRAQFQLQHYSQACASFARAVALRPDEVVIWREYGEALLRADQSEAALECYETITQLQPTDADNWIRLGSLLRELLRPAEAVNSFNIALELAPHDFFTWFSRGLAEADLTLHEDAAKSFQRALALNLNDGAAQHQLALTYLPRFLAALAEGHVFNAREYWQKAVALGRQARSADWDAQELHALQTAADLGHQRLVKALLAGLEGNALLEPLRIGK